MRIALGTISKQKKKLLEETLKELKIKAEIEACSILSGIRDLPIKDEEIEQSSAERAKIALDQDKKADFALGIERGYQVTEEGVYEMFCWVTIVDKAGKQVSARAKSLLPLLSIQQISSESEKLGDYVKLFLKADTKSERVEKKPMIQEAMKMVLAGYLSE